ADVIAQHQDTPSPLQAAAEASRFGVGSESNMQRFAPPAYLTGTIWDWRETDAAIVKAIMNGQFKSEDYYGGLSDKMVTLGPFNERVPEDVRALVELRGIVKAFPGSVANAGIDLAVYPGEVLAILGENGAGKSTLMSILAGLYRPDAGTIAFDGRLVDLRSPGDAVELGIGMVHQH